MENHRGGGVMRAPKERFDFVHEFLSRVFGEDLHAKRILSLTNGTLGVMTGAALAVLLLLWLTVEDGCTGKRTSEGCEVSIQRNEVWDLAYTSSIEQRYACL